MNFNHLSYVLTYRVQSVFWVVFFQTLCYLTSWWSWWWSWWCCWLILLCCWLNGNVLARDFPLRGPKGLDWEPLDVILLPKAALLRATPSFSANPPPKVSERRVAEKRSCVVTWKISKLLTWRHLCTSNFNYLSKAAHFLPHRKLAHLRNAQLIIQTLIFRLLQGLPASPIFALKIVMK